MFGKYYDPWKKGSAMCCYADLIPTIQTTQCAENSFVQCSQEMKAERCYSLNANSVMFSRKAVQGHIEEKGQNTVLNLA